MTRVVFASDSHLNKHYARMTPDQLAERRNQLRRAWRATVDHAIAERADVYIHGGDLFDGPNPRAAEMIWAAEQFRRLHEAGIRTLLIGGNHDIPKTRSQGATPQRLYDAVGMAHVFTDPTAVRWWCEEVGGLRLAVGGLPPDPRLDPDIDPLTSLVEEIVRPEGCDVALLVTHYAVEGMLHPLANEPVIMKDSIAKLRGVVDALLVGHIHEQRTMDVGGVPVIFPGPTERLSFGELEVRCGFMELTVQAGKVDRVKGRHRKVTPQPMRRVTLRATDLPAEEPNEWLQEQLRSISSGDQILQLLLAGPLPRRVYQSLRFRELWQLGHDLNFYFDLDRHGLVVAGDGEAGVVPGAERVSVRAELARVGQALVAAADDEAEKALRRAAAELVLEEYGTADLDDEAEERPAVAAPVPNGQLRLEEA
jgi:DNA repair exonuclease SbcCD nuclease subunit